MQTEFLVDRNFKKYAYYQYDPQGNKSLYRMSDMKRLGTYYPKLNETRDIQFNKVGLAGDQLLSLL